MSKEKLKNDPIGEKICVVGLGYVGLPVAVQLAARGQDVLGFDVNVKRVEELREGHDRTNEVSKAELGLSSLRFSSDESDLDGCTFFIVTVPTPIDFNKQPDLGAVKAASRTVARHISPGACVVYESTVYPGVTEEVCRPILAEVSGLRPSEDFKLGYSPERINPGDKEHTLAKIIKVVSGEDEETLERVARVYESIVDAGVHRAPSIKVAEAAKVIENTQRDLNIALMNELSVIFHHMNIQTHDVLAAAGTKWNFLRFTPGLVGGHCIGVDPYYLTAKAEELGYHPEVILAGRRINDNMGRYVAQALIKQLIKSGRDVAQAKVLILGITFKENVPDIRNSRVIDIINELREYGINPTVSDPRADGDEVKHEYGIDLMPMESLKNYDVLVLASPHRELVEKFEQLAQGHLAADGIVVDLKSAVLGHPALNGRTYWSL